MNPDCNILNPLQRDGLSQNKRLIQALHPSYVAIDERDIADLLLYAKDYARLIQFYSLENNPSGDWRKFIESDITTLVAIIQKFEAAKFKEDYQAATNFEERFTAILGIIEVAYAWFTQAERGLKVYATLERVINSILENSLTSAIAFAKRIDIVDVGFQFANLDTDFINLDVNAIDADTTLFPSNTISNPEDLAIANRKINRVFQTAFEGVLSVKLQAADFLEETLEEYHHHQPHMALFLAFLKLFGIAQKHQNTITKRHLDFYYQEVLQLQLKSEQPDEVHLVFKLAKNFQTNLLEEDTVLKAGKDDLGANVFYATDNQLIVNKTKIADQGLKTIFLDKAYGDAANPPVPNELDESTTYTIKNIYAAPMANTLDGIEESLEDGDNWPTLGSGTMPYGKVGFAISSPMFQLREGTRTITLTFTVDNSNGIISAGNKTHLEQELRDNILLTYSGEEEWVPTQFTNVTINAPTSTSPTIAFEITLNPEDAPFLPFHAGLGPPSFQTALPTLQMILDNEGLSHESVDNIISTMTIRGVKENATTYLEGESYPTGEIVKHKGEWYHASVPISGNEPRPDSTVWEKIEKSYSYQYFQKLPLKVLTINVDVQGMQNLVLENDIGILNPAKPFLPFGPIPKVGSKFFIGSDEVFSKKLSSITLDGDWVDLPMFNLNTHYEKYADPPEVTDNAYFKAQLELLYHGKWFTSTDSLTPLTTNQVDLFSPANAADPPDPTFTATVAFDPTQMQSGNINGSVDTLIPQLNRGFFRLNLLQDFFHKQFPKLIATAAIAQDEDLIPNEPYTPTISSFKLGYIAETEIDFADISLEDSTEQFFHISPFGWQAFYPNSENLPKEVLPSQLLVPEFKVSEKPNQWNIEETDAEGTLYIGLKDLEPAQIVSFLFQMAEGSADPDLPKQSIHWSFLADNQWVDFDRTQVLSDTTNELLTSGIVSLTMPKQMTDNNSILPGGSYWIKVATGRLVKAISQCIIVMPQAVKASFRKNPDNDLTRLAAALPAETISKLRQRQAAIKTVLQPFSSFNGKIKEQNSTPENVTGNDRFDLKYNEFYVRVSERLRHKNRAVTIVDYERLVLQQFPAVYKVKCLNHTSIEKVYDGNLQAASEHAPGFVKVIVMPNLRNRNAVNPLQPKISASKLDAIKNYLMPLKCDFVTLEVQNPLFEEVAVEFLVKFFPGFDKGFYEKQLQEDIVRFLSPWLYDEGAELSLGGKVHRSVILNFVEERVYVDYVTDFKLHHYVPGLPPKLDVEEAIATTSSSVIVSKPASYHSIDPDNIAPC